MRNIRVLKKVHVYFHIWSFLLDHIRLSCIIGHRTFASVCCSLLSASVLFLPHISAAERKTLIKKAALCFSIQEARGLLFLYMIFSSLYTYFNLMIVYTFILLLPSFRTLTKYPLSGFLSDVPEEAKSYQVLTPAKFVPAYTLTWPL